MVDRPDLAAMMLPLVRALMAAEEPVLEANGVTMWGYTVLHALDGNPTRTQAALAERIGADKTRIIPTLDELEAAGLIDRQPDPADRRVHLLSVTERGRKVKEATQREIQAGEEHWLGELNESDRDAFLRALHQIWRIKEPPGKQT